MVVTYKGDGTDFLNGVPARDLTDEEFQALDEEAQAAVTASTLYEAGGKRASARPAAPSPFANAPQTPVTNAESVAPVVAPGA